MAENTTTNPFSSLIKQATTNTTNLTPEALSQRYDGNISVRTLANWRTQGKGPKFRRLGGVILYPIEEVEAWEQSNTYGSTSNYKAS